MAKAWNYEGEQLLRACKDIDYTIIRPGVMGRVDDVPALLRRPGQPGDQGDDPVVKGFACGARAQRRLPHPHAGADVLPRGQYGG